MFVRSMQNSVIPVKHRHSGKVPSFRRAKSRHSGKSPVIPAKAGIQKGGAATYVYLAQRVLNSLLTVSSHSRNHRVTILSYFYVFGTGRVHDLLISDDTAKDRNPLPPNCPSRAIQCGMALSSGEAGITPECCREPMTPTTSTSTL